MVSDEDRLQVERLQNLVQGFGWTIGTIDYTDEIIRVVLTRPVSGVPVEISAGPG